MTNWTKIKQALALVNMQEPNCLFIAADVRMEYLHFAEIDYEDDFKPVEKELSALGVVFVAKYETIAIERESLWGNRKNKD